MTIRKRISFGILNFFNFRNYAFACHSDRATPYRSTGQDLGASGEPALSVAEWESVNARFAFNRNTLK